MSLTPRRLIAFAALFSVTSASLATPVVAQQESPAVPSPGAWVRYHVTGQAAGREIIQQTTLRFLDRVRESGEDLQWLEVEQKHLEPADPPYHGVMKFLVPVDQLENSAAPLLSTRRSWFRDNDAASQRYEDQDTSDVFARVNVSLGPLLLFLPGSRREELTTDAPLRIEFERGHLDCPRVLAGRQTTGFQPRTIPARIEYRWDYSVRLHPDLPCGFAAAKYQYTRLEIAPDGTVEDTSDAGTREYSLQDFGAGATSSLPDAR